MTENEPENEFICAACGERHSGHPHKVCVDINIERRSEYFLAHNRSLFSSDNTYELYCQRCAYGIAAYLTERMGIGRLNKGSLTDKIARVRAECSMADIGRKLWNGIEVY